MASPFDSLTLPQVREQLASASSALQPLPYTDEVRLRAGVALDADRVNAAFYAGDHWQQGAGWVGPQPNPADADAMQVLADIWRAFVSQNAVKEVVNRHRDGVVGREPAWSFTPRRPLDEAEQPKRDEKKLIKEAEAALTTWWDARKGLKLAQQAVVTLLLHGRATLRIFVPAGVLATTDPATGDAIPPQVPAGDLAQSLGRIYVAHPAPSQAGVLTDAATQQQASVYLYQDDAGHTCAEVSYVDLATGQTVLRILGDDAAQDVTLPLDGHLFLMEVTRDALISEQIRQLQKQLNLAKTMEGRNAVQGGFLERIILGGQMPGAYVDDPTAPADSEGRRRRFKPSPMKIGAGRTNWIAGVPIRDAATGNVTGYTTPSVVYRDPVSPETFEMTADAARRAILEEAQQLHALIAGDATASGESRKQARADFEKSLMTTKGEVDSLVRWLLETALALAAVFSGRAGQFAQLRAVCDCRIDTGPLSGDEQQQILNQVQADLLDDETAMSRLGVEDVAAVKARIAAAKAERQAQAQAISGGAATPTSGDPSAPGTADRQTPSDATTPSANTPGNPAP